MMRKYACCLFVFLTGCATYYVPPTTGDVAQIRISYPQSSGVIWAYISKYDSCENKSVLGNVGAFRRTDSDKNTDIPVDQSLSPEAYFDKSIEAGKEVNISMAGTRPGYFCKVAAIFKPEVNETYEASFVWDRPDVNRVSCYIEIDRLKMSGSQLIRIKEVSRKADKVCSYDMF